MNKLFVVCLVMTCAPAEAKDWSWMRRSKNIEDRRGEVQAPRPTWSAIPVKPIVGVLPATKKED
jgi:hypothetical protein